LFVKKVRSCSLQFLIFQRLLDLNYSPLSALNEANLISATQTLNLNPTMHCLKRHKLVEKLEIKITNLRFALLFVEICR
jgi:hypothetical protein